jgi:GxxExxY protein
MALGPGYDESVYLNALTAEMDAQSISYKLDHPFNVLFKGKVIGQTIADVYVDGRFLVEVMARPGQIGSGERIALRGQLRAADLVLGLIINFGERRLKDGLVRVLNPSKLAPAEGGEHDHDDEGDYEDDEPAGA